MPVGSQATRSARCIPDVNQLERVMIKSIGLALAIATLFFCYAHDGR